MGSQPATLERLLRPVRWLLMTTRQIKPAAKVGQALSRTLDTKELSAWPELVRLPLGAAGCGCYLSALRPNGSLVVFIVPYYLRGIVVRKGPDYAVADANLNVDFRCNMVFCHRACDHELAD